MNLNTVVRIPVLNNLVGKMIPRAKSMLIAHLFQRYEYYNGMEKKLI